MFLDYDICKSKDWVYNFYVKAPSENDCGIDGCTSGYCEFCCSICPPEQGLIDNDCNDLSSRAGIELNLEFIFNSNPDPNTE